MTGLAIGLVFAGTTPRPAASGPTATLAQPSAGPGSASRPPFGEHVHAPIPSAYAGAHIPARVWTDPKMLARGREIYVEKCASCHGERGDGNAPAGLALPLRPADLTDAKMVAEMPGNYWFWLVSEGGQVEPFKSQGSAMPAWKQDLSVSDRWAVIAYAHTLSEHHGPHTPSEHPEMTHGHSHGGHGHGTSPARPGGAGGSPSAPPTK
jgi:mono/diheme cytochrome c family protein